MLQYSISIILLLGTIVLSNRNVNINTGTDFYKNVVINKKSSSAIISLPNFQNLCYLLVDDNDDRVRFY